MSSAFVKALNLPVIFNTCLLFRQLKDSPIQRVQMYVIIEEKEATYPSGAF